MNYFYMNKRKRLIYYGCQNLTINNLYSHYFLTFLKPTNFYERIHVATVHWASIITKTESRGILQTYFIKMGIGSIMFLQ